MALQIPVLRIKRPAWDSFRIRERVRPMVVDRKRRNFMRHMSKLVAGAAAVLLLSSVAAGAQSGGAGGGATGGAAGTNSAGTANSSGGRAPAGITTGASGTGQTSLDGKPRTGDEQVDKQDREVDKKVKNICKGC
jgi:hypothetical protein